MIKNITKIKIPGFLFSGVSCGIKKNNGKDIGIIFSETPAICAGVFTKNRVKAAPVKLDIKNIKSSFTRAILVNSGNANACTGKKGDKDALYMAETAAEKLGIKSKEVLVASTGVIGNLLPMDKVIPGIEKACEKLNPTGIDDFSHAIMTTDLYQKTAYEKIKIDGKDISIFGVAKGAGMICPNMATLLSFVVTDLCIDKKHLTGCLKDAVNRSYNLITVDTDTSTNDSVIVMANGLAGNKKILNYNKDYENFNTALIKILKKLAKLIVEDGEGATKYITIKVKNAKTKIEAKKIAMSVAKSTLVKTAFFGEDANWGRIICAVGYSGVKVNPDNIDIYIGKIKVASAGSRVEGISEQKLKKILEKKEIAVDIDINQGNCSEEVYASDLSFDYVKVNASYRS
ncbi:bifunctional glutamate N-acetyltransferase/amino-acid acetyltransferase ArgJ [Candidatus Desantisbacteria bacterium]|nr:bifunctional glutamate N-acetyltransferase/amino-acid acetyltransferase ArgJ [Candidatus Desantisbacteria bacterium]